VDEHGSITGEATAPGSLSARACAAFGADLYRRLAAAGRNNVFSPASIAAGLLMALCGARGDTAAEMAAVLHLSRQGAAREGLRLLSARAREIVGGGELMFRAPNTIWVQSGLPLVPQFTALLRDVAAATVLRADFAGDTGLANGQINRVIEEQTEGKIQDLMTRGPLDRHTRLVLANAVYLKARWAHGFPVGATSDAPFYPGGAAVGTLIKVRMMRLTNDLGYLRGEGYQAVVLPYAGGQLAMAVVLPDGPLASLQPKVAAVGFGGLLAGVARRRVTLALPRFRQAASFDLTDALASLGMQRALNRRGADFTEITRAEPLYISAVAHKAYIDVDEYGTEAAAASAVRIMRRTVVHAAPPVTMIVDRPFLFMITDTVAGYPLFLGQVTSPSAN
jgi:serine protease inhibitor